MEDINCKNCEFLIPYESEMRNNGFICKFCPLYDKERRFYMKQKNRQINSIILADVYYDEINKEEKKKYCKKIQLKNLEKL